MTRQSFDQLHEPRTWYGLSGTRLTGEQVAQHLEAAARLMERENWDPQVHAPFSGRHLRDALHSTAQDGMGDADTQWVARTVMETLLRAHTGAPYVDYEIWSEHRDRTLTDVLNLLRAAAIVARETGPSAPPPTRPQLTAPDSPSITGGAR
ncbi:hypothetical protein C3492_35710 [Streptomyces sp. Ru62]|uniref:DUF6197 family protein n=1 Tax=Streptomyces sp. Ru62 TaxID=2080745 RepID=UPI000CDDDC88|nr:hypothetical protein [Streptomyces sp. Ru62]POX58879.1 hypothetical protein C3492_35710 [Streptomyces sp. Ru62]